MQLSSRGFVSGFFIQRDVFAKIFDGQFKRGMGLIFGSGE